MIEGKADTMLNGDEDGKPLFAPVVRCVDTEPFTEFWLKQTKPGPFLSEQAAVATAWELGERLGFTMRGKKPGKPKEEPEQVTD